MQTESSIRVAVDIGGTFTDLHLHNPASGEAFAWKTPSTPEDLSLGLITGLREIAALAGIALADIGLILHGSTIATNAVLERKLPRGALITTLGFRDVLEIGRHMRRNVYTLRAEPRSVLIPRQRRYEVPERINARGEIEEPLDEQALHEVIDELIERQIETVAVVFLHGYRNSAHEQRVQDLLKERAPEISVAVSSHASPEIREFERTSTTVLNALLQPVISDYLAQLGDRLAAEGITAGLYLVQSNGGLTTAQDAALLPARLLLSGPAGGAMAMASLARRHKISNLVGFDMGGTSSDISVVRDYSIGETAESSIDGLPVRVPMVEIRTIGAGGGSIARLEAQALRVGPLSAGADPGPVCYQRGGSEPTVTDANAVLGRIDPEGFRTGGIQLDVPAAANALEQQIAEPLELAADKAAAGVLDVASSHMAAAIRLSLFEKGADPADFALAPFGGAAGLHACAVAQELGVERILFPANASTLSALGILQADLRHDLSLSHLQPADESAVPVLVESVKHLHNQATSLLDKNGFVAANRRICFSCDMRYRGQAFELTVPWPALESDSEAMILPDGDAVARLAASFHELHRQRFAHAVPQDAVEIVTLRMAAVGLLPKAVPAGRRDDSDSVPCAPVGSTRTLYIDDERREVSCYRREDIRLGQSPVSGPAVIEEAYTVLLIEQGWQLRSVGDGDLLCEKQREQPDD